MSKNTSAPAAANTQAADAAAAGADKASETAATAAGAAAPTDAGSLTTGNPTLTEVKAVVASDVEVAPNMPKVGDRVMLQANFGRMVNPLQPTTEQELDIDKITKTTFDAWHEVQWKAGKLRNAAV